MFGIILKKFIVLLASTVNASNHKKCVSESNQKCEIQPTLINLHHNDTDKNSTTTLLRLNLIDLLEIVIL